MEQTIRLGTVNLLLNKTSNETKYQLLNRTIKVLDLSMNTDITTIPLYVFEGCSELEEITLPASITYIKGGSFNGCNKISRFYFNGTIEQWNSIEKEDFNAGTSMAKPWYNNSSITNIICSNGTVELLGG